MNDNAEAIILVIVLLVALALFLIPFILFFIYVFYQNSKRNRIRTKVLAANQQLVGGRQWFPVRYASEPRFKSWWKVFPWEGAGVLVTAPASVLFIGETNSGAPVALQFTSANARLNWLGKCPWPNGAVSWFEAVTPNEKHYFSSETGAFIFGSHKGTREIFDEASRSFAAQGA